MISPSDRPNLSQLRTQLQLLDIRVRWLRRAAAVVGVLLFLACMGLWIAPNGASWGR